MDEHSENTDEFCSHLNLHPIPTASSYFQRPNPAESRSRWLIMQTGGQEG